MLNLKDRTMLVEEKTSLKNNRMSGYEFLKKTGFLLDGGNTLSHKDSRETRIIPRKNAGTGLKGFNLPSES